MSADSHGENEVQNIVLVTAVIGQQQLPHPHGSFVITTSAAVWPVCDISSPVDHNCYSDEPTVTLIEMHLVRFMHVSTDKLFQNIYTNENSSCRATVTQRALGIFVNIINMSPL